MERAVAAAAAPERRAHIAHAAALLLDSTADPAGGGLLLRGLEHQPFPRAALGVDPLVVDGLLRLARLAEGLAPALRNHPDAQVRRAAAALAARAHPLRLGLHD